MLTGTRRFSGRRFVADTDLTEKRKEKTSGFRVQLVT